MGRYVPPEHEGITSANKLAGKYDSFMKPISGLCLLITGMHSEIALEKQAKAYLLFDLRCHFQSGAIHAQSPQSSDKVSDSMRKRKKLEITTVLLFSVFE